MLHQGMVPFGRHGVRAKALVVKRRLLTREFEFEVVHEVMAGKTQPDAAGEYTIDQMPSNKKSARSS